MLWDGSNIAGSLIHRILPGLLYQVAILYFGAQFTKPYAEYAVQN
jgi:hypothetical protein